jgi:hypothetical protein
MRVVLAHPRTMFHLYTCILCGGDAAFAAVWSVTTIVEVAAVTTTRRRWSWLTTSSTPMRDYIGSQLQLFFRCSARLVVATIYDPFTYKFPVCNDRCSARVAYLLPYNGIRVVLHGIDWINRGWKEVEVECVNVTKWLVHVISLLCAWHIPTGWNYHRD